MPSPSHHTRPLIDDKVIADKSGMTADYVKKVFRHLENDGKGISCEQLEKFLKNASFSSDQKSILDKVGPFVTNPTAAGLKSILKCLSNSDMQVYACEKMGKSWSRLNESEKDDVVSAIGFSNDKEKARKGLTH